MIYSLNYRMKKIQLIGGGISIPHLPVYSLTDFDDLLAIYPYSKDRFMLKFSMEVLEQTYPHLLQKNSKLTWKE